MKELIARVRSVAPLVQWTHCSIHREALAVKGLDECLKKTLDGAVKIVNFIKARPKNSRLFGVLCDEMGSEHKQLLLHCEVRWLSRVLHDFLETNEVKIDEATATTIQDHLKSLASNLRNYFPKIEEEIQWIRNPFEEDYLKKLKISASEED
ncbi:hypothetical protein QTP88_001956 [Uroleucon formosanum]